MFSVAVPTMLVQPGCDVGGSMSIPDTSAISSGSAGAGGLTFRSVSADDSMAFSRLPGTDASHPPQSMNSGCVSPGAIVHGWHGQGLIGWHGIPMTAPHHGHATIRPTRLWATIRATRGPALIPPARGRATTPAARGEAFSSPPWHRGTAD